MLPELFPQLTAGEWKEAKELGALMSVCSMQIEPWLCRSCADGPEPLSLGSRFALAACSRMQVLEDIAWSANLAKLTSRKFPSWTHRFCMMNPCQIHEKSGSRVWGRGHCSHPRSPRGFGWLETIFLGKPGVKLTWNYIWVGLDRIVNYVNCIFDDFAILSFLKGAT